MNNEDEQDKQFVGIVQFTLFLYAAILIIAGIVFLLGLFVFTDNEVILFSKISSQRIFIEEDPIKKLDDHLRKMDILAAQLSMDLPVQLPTGEKGKTQ